MDVFVIDDSAAKEPSRPGMGPLVGVGGVHVPSGSVRWLERSLDALCRATGFPDGEEFKWSPKRNSWMHSGLVEDGRRDFFLAALKLAAEAGATAIVVAEDTHRGRAHRESATAQDDVVTLFLERAQNHLNAIGAEALLIFDKPSGGQQKELAFLADCIGTIRAGTTWVEFDRLTLALASDSKLVRLLQLADVVASCTVQRMGGETPWTPPVFEAIRPMLRRDYGRVGGMGLKLQPDFCFGNLYHWLLGDVDHWKQGRQFLLPHSGWPYAEAPDRW